MQTFNNYLKSAVGKLGIKDCEASSNVGNRKIQGPSEY